MAPPQARGAPSDGCTVNTQGLVVSRLFWSFGSVFYTSCILMLLGHPVSCGALVPYLWGVSLAPLAFTAVYRRGWGEGPWLSLGVMGLPITFGLPFRGLQPATWVLA